MLPMAGLHTSHPIASFVTPTVSIMAFEVFRFFILVQEMSNSETNESRMQPYLTTLKSSERDMLK
jgi:hypothetical protein